MKSTIELQKEYLLRCQLPTGTFRVTPQSNWINPYFTHMGLLGLTLLGVELDAVKRQINWYLSHLTAKGYVNDYRWEAQLETDMGKADSEDSYNATLFTLLSAYVKQTEESKWVEEQRDKLLRVLNGLIQLQQKDGLTWAKASYKVKFLMDNCEVLRGLEEAFFLFTLIGDRSSAALALGSAQRCRIGLNSMYDEKKQCYAVYERTYPKWKKWYPDATSQAFPLLYNLLPPDDSLANQLYQRIVEHFPSFEEFQTGDIYPWMIIGECAALMGDLERAERMLWAAENLYIFGPRQQNWLIHEAGAYIRIAHRLMK